MRRDKEEARHLRLNGKSYQEISEILKTPKSTLSGWFGKEDWSAEIRKKLTDAIQEAHTVRLIELNKVRGEHLDQTYEEARREATEELELLKYNPLFIAGLMLYWGEGDKLSKSKVRLTNTDARMIKTFVLFLREVCNIPEDKIRAQILVYPDLNEAETKAYWVKESGIAPDRFTKSTLIQGRHATRRLGYGVCMAYVSSSYFKAKVLTWIELLPKELISNQYYENIGINAAIV